MKIDLECKNVRISGTGQPLTQATAPRESELRGGVKYFVTSVVANLGFFASVKSRVWKEGFRSIEEMVPGIKNYSTSLTRTPLKGCGRVYSRDTKVLGALGGDGFEMGHGGITTSQETGELVTAVPINQEANTNGRILVLLCWCRRRGRLKQSESFRGSHAIIGCLWRVFFKWYCPHLDIHTTASQTRGGAVYSRVILARF